MKGPGWLWAMVLVSLLFVQITTFGIYPMPAFATSSSPLIVGPSIQTGSSVTVPTGGSTYFYAATEGGSFNISSVDFIQDLAVTNQGGLQSAIIGHSSSTTGTYNPNGALFPIIGGIGVTTPSYNMQKFSNNGQTTLSNSFTLASDSLVVLVSASSNNAPFLSISSPFTVTGSGSSSCCSTVVFATASLTAGTYPFTVAYSACSPPCTSQTNAMAIGVVLYVFPLSIDSTPPVLTPPSNSNAGSTSNNGLKFQSMFIPNLTSNDYSMVLEITPAIPNLYFTWSDTQAIELVKSLYQQLGSNGFTIKNKSNFSIDVVTNSFSNSLGGKLTEGLIACSDLSSGIIGRVNVLGYDGAVLSIPEIISNSVSGNPCGDNFITDLMNATFATLSSGVTAFENDYRNGGVITPSDQPNYVPTYIITDQHSTSQKLIIVITGLTPSASKESVTFTYSGQDDIGNSYLAGPLLLTENNFSTSQMMETPTPLNSNANPLQSFFTWLFHLIVQQ